MKLLFFIFIIIYISLSKTFAQVDLPQAIIVPTGSLGEVSEIRKKILEKTLESSLDDHFAIVPKDLFEEAQEKAFEELDYEECTEEQCIVLIKEMLQVENSFQLVLMAEGSDTYLSLNWNNLERKRVEEDICENCNTKNLRESINSLVQRFAKEFSENEILYDEIFSEEEKNNELDNQLVKNNKIEKSKNNINTMLREYRALSYNASNQNYNAFIEKYKNDEFAQKQITEIRNKLIKPSKSIFKRREDYKTIVEQSKEILGCSWFCEDPLVLPDFHGNFHILKYNRIQISASTYPWIDSGIIIDDKSKYIVKMFAYGETKNCDNCKTNRNGSNGIRYKIGDNDEIYNPRFNQGLSTILYFNRTGELQFAYKDWRKWPPPRNWYKDNKGKIVIDLFIYEKNKQDQFFNFLKETKNLNPEDKNMQKVTL